jgi:archaellum biogenesis ATPase FlaH
MKAQDKTIRLSSLFKRKEKAERLVQFFENEEIALIFDDVEAGIIEQLKDASFVGEESKVGSLLAELRCIGKLRKTIVLAVNELKAVNHNIEVTENGR